MFAPLNGQIVALSDVPDETFSAGVLGQGVAILPSEGKLYSPVDGTVTQVFDTNHAICLATASGAEILIHIGLETVTLKGKHFTPKVKDGDTVKAGDLLIEFDLDEIKKQFKTYTPILITNAEDYSSLEILKGTGTAAVGEPLYEAKA